jgi:hypothetical protein
MEPSSFRKIGEPEEYFDEALDRIIFYVQYEK